MRVVASEDVQLVLDLLSGVNSLVADFDNLVDPEKRIAMRNQCFDLGSVHIGMLTEYWLGFRRNQRGFRVTTM